MPSARSLLGRRRPPRRPRPRRAPGRGGSRPASRTPSPRPPAARSLRGATPGRGTRRRGRAPRAARSGRTPRAARRRRGARAATASSFVGPTTTSSSPASRAAASAASWFLRPWIAPTASAYVADACARLAGRERRVDAVRRHDDLLRREAVELDEVALRPLRDGEHARRAPRGARDDPPEDEPVAAAHRAPSARRRGRGS